jgi:hypothetical protein
MDFLNSFSKNTQIPKFMNIRLVGAELFHADRRTGGQADMTKLMVHFRNFANVSNKTVKVLLFFHENNGYANAPNYKVLLLFCNLLIIIAEEDWRKADNCPDITLY